MTDYRPGWAFGPFLTEWIHRSGMSKRAVARLTGISEGRIRQLETGYQKNKGVEIPISTSVRTVRMLQEVLHFPLREGLERAGLDDAISDSDEVAELDATMPELDPGLSRWTVEDLLQEVANRYDRLAMTQSDGLWTSNRGGDAVTMQDREGGDESGDTAPTRDALELAAREVEIQRGEDDPDDMEPR